MARRGKSYLIPSPPQQDQLSDILSETDRLKAIIETSFDGIYITDGNAVTLMINKSYETISGLRREHMLGKDMRTLERTGVISRSGTLLALEAGKAVTLDQTFKTGRRAIITSTPTFDQDNRVVMVVTNVRDITEMYALKKKLEESWAHTRQYRDELEAMRRKLTAHDGIIAVDEAMVSVLHTADKLAALDATVLLVGENGVGKSEIAKRIYSKSPRKKEKFITASCEAIPSDAIDRELFGQEWDGPLGKEYKPGLFELANGGTLYLEEVGELPPKVQMKVCRVIRDQAVIRIGSMEPMKISVRVLASSTQNLEELVAQKRFREDLYYCLNALSIEIPPLRRRRGDIIPFVQYFTSELNKKYGMKKRFSQIALLGMKNYDWPGNVQELQHVVERAIVLSAGDPIEPEDLPISAGMFTDEADLELLTEPVDLKKILRQLERGYIERAYARYGNVRDAAKSLGMDPSTFVRKRQHPG